MKTIHESLCEMLELIQKLKESGIEVKILCKPQKIEDVPQDFSESLVNAFLPRITEFFQNEDNKKEYEQWKQERDKASAV